MKYIFGTPLYTFYISIKGVTNVTTGEIFKTIFEAAEKYKCTRKGIRNNCNGTRKDYNGYIWKYTNLE